MSIKQSILVVTFNHEDYINECLDSLVNQTELPYEIIISDDCSTDNTWKIIEDFHRKYPNLFKIYQNKKNLGIFENIHKIRGLSTGNVVNFCSGDDLLKSKTIEKISNAISINNLNPEKDYFIIVLNSIHLYPDGKEWVFNNFKYRDFSIMRLKLRFGISFRCTGYSKRLFKTVGSEKRVLEIYPDIGLGADSIKGYEELKLSKQTIFVDYAGPVYRLSTGITSMLSNKFHLNSQLKLNEIIKKKYEEYWNYKDIKYIDYITYSCKFKLNPTFKLFFITLYYSLLNINNFTSNYTWVRSLNVFLPEKLYKFFKYKIYPLIRKL